MLERRAMLSLGGGVEETNAVWTAIDDPKWFDMDAGDGLQTGEQAHIVLTDTSMQGVSGRIHTPGVWVDSVRRNGQDFSALTIPGSGYTDVVGMPQLPVVRSLLSVPEGVEVSASVEGQPQFWSRAEVGLQHTLRPVQAPIEKLEGALKSTSLQWDQAAYLVDQFEPQPTIRVLEAGQRAGERLVMLEVAPVAYNPASETVRIYETLTFHLAFSAIAGEGWATNVSFTGARLADVSPDHSLEPVTTIGAGGARRLLIIAHNDFVAGVAPLVSFKSSQGWTVDLASTATTGATTGAIRNYIRAQYDNPSTRPNALLLVGDTDRVPNFIGVGEDSPATDLYYACMNGDSDWYPEFPVGRLSVANSGELGDVIAKTIAYEASSEGGWTNQAAFLAGIDNASITENTHNLVISRYFEPLGYTSHKLYQRTYGATTQDVRNAFSSGQALGVYSGHGSETRWADGPVFTQNDVRALTNAGKYPLIASFACSTGDFAYSSGESLMETWLRAPDQGAVVAVGSSVTSYWTEDDILEQKLFDAIFSPTENRLSFGDAWMRAKELYLAHFGPTATTRRYFEMYNVLGDPTAEVLGLGFGIRSPADLPLAYLEEPYEYSLHASRGTEPYTWSVTTGRLPPGLTLDATGGVIHGTALESGRYDFTITVTDADDRVVSMPCHASVAERLEFTSPAGLPAGSVQVPYTVEFAAQGGTAPYHWRLVGAGQYVESSSVSSSLGGGVAMGWQDDDSTWQLSLPWSFPFYDRHFSTVNVSSNGYLDFANDVDDYENSREAFEANVRIAPLWDDLDTSDGDIYVTQTDDYVAIRWVGVTFEEGTPVDFEAVLERDGSIRFNYRLDHLGLTPTIGISAGDGSHHTLSSRDGNATIPAGASSLFQYAAPLPGGVAFDPATARLVGVPKEKGRFNLTIEVRDSGMPAQSVSRDFVLDVMELPFLSLSLPEAAHEGAGPLLGGGSVSIASAMNGDLVVSLQSSDPTELRLPATTVVIPAGRVSATFDLWIEDDTLLDGTQTPTITAQCLGYVDAAGSIRVHDNENAQLSLSLIETAAEGAGLLIGQGRVELSAVAQRDVLVSLSSSDLTEGVVPATVLIYAGQAAATFDVRVVDDQEIDGPQSVTVTAYVENWMSGSAGILIGDNDAYLTVQMPTKVWEGQATLHEAGLVSLGGTMPVEVTVSLTSNDTSELALPSLVTIPAGKRSARFDLIVQDDGDGDGAQSVTVTAAGVGLVSGSGATQVGDNELHHFTFEPIANPQTASVPFTVHLTARDINSEVIEVYTGQTLLTGAGEHGPVPVEIGSGDKPPAVPVAGETIYPTASLPLGAGGKKDLGTYHDYAELTAALAAYAATYPSIAQLVSIGRSTEGRELWAMKISDNPALEEDEPEVKYLAAMHGDEPVGTEMCLYFIDDLLTDYGSDPRIASLVDETEIWIVPLLNPDGRETGQRENAGGADLNRSFPEGASTPIGNVIDGPPMDLAGRPPEVGAVMQWSAAHSFTLAANFHSGSLVVNYPYDNAGLGDVDSPTPDDALFEQLAEIYSSHNLPMWNSAEFPHGITNGAAWYTVEGGMQDWNYRYAGCNEVTIELSDDPWPAASALPELWADNRESMLSYFESVHSGVRGLVTDVVTGEPVFAKVLVQRNSHPVFTDPQVGDYHRMLLPGTYDLTFSAPGYASRTIRDVLVTARGETRVNVLLAPVSAGAVFFDGRWTGSVSVVALDENVMLSVDDGQGHQAASNAFDVVAGSVDHYVFSPISSPQSASTPWVATIAAHDAHGYLASSFEGPVALSARTASTQPVAIGTGTRTWSQPMPTWWHDSRTQVIYLRSEIGPAAVITGLALEVTTPPEQTLNHWTIRMRHTPLSSFADPAWESSGWVTVLQSNQTIHTAGWVDFALSTPFEYNGVDNLMVDFSYNNSSYTLEAECRATETGQIRSVYYASDSSFGDPLTWSGHSPLPDSSRLIPNLRLLTQGRVPISPELSGTFVNGVWTGEISVLTTSAGVYLKADDGHGHRGQSGVFAVEPKPPARVVAEHVFYNQSAFDGNDPAANALDDAAIATDKIALRPGQQASFTNYTSYSRGINGIMVDLAYPAGIVSAKDFRFRVGNDDNPSGWTTVAVEPAISVRRGAGGEGSDRVTITWPNQAIAQQWLEVAVLATATTGLVQDHVFYFGNATGETGNSSSDARVNAVDLLMARGQLSHALKSLPVDVATDFNRDARVNALDILLARNHQTGFGDALRLITPPVAKAAVRKTSDFAAASTALGWIYQYELPAKRSARKGESS